MISWAAHRAKLRRAASPGDIREAGIRIYQCGFDLERRLVIHAVPMDDVGHLHPSQTNVADAPELVAELVVLEVLLGPNVGEHAVASSLPHVERLAVPRVDEPVHVCLEPTGHFGRKGVRAGNAVTMIASERGAHRASPHRPDQGP